MKALKYLHNKFKQKLPSYIPQLRCEDTTKIINRTAVGEKTIKYCPQYFDGLSCWDETPAGKTATQNCPTALAAFNQSIILSNACDQNGTWLDMSNKKYYDCINNEYSNMVNEVLFYVFLISLISLISTLIIFRFSKKQWSEKKICHANLFMAFSLYYMTWLIWHKTVSIYPSAILENKLFCKLIHMICMYFLIASYSWMFCESILLHLTLINVFHDEYFWRKVLSFVGWMLPAIITTTYTVLRAFSESDDMLCWVQENVTTYYILNVIVRAIQICSAVIVLSCVGIAVKKQHPIRNRSNRCGYWLGVCKWCLKVVQVICILFMLSGIHLSIEPLRMPAEIPGEETQHLISAALIGLQGFILGLVYGFTDPEFLNILGQYLCRGANPQHPVEIEMQSMNIVRSENRRTTQEEYF